MKLTVRFGMSVSGSPDEAADVSRLRKEIDRVGRLSGRVSLDEPLVEDFNRIIRDLGALFARARARKARRRRGG